MKELKQGLASAYGQQVAPSWMYLKTKPLKSRGSTFMESLKKKIEKLLNESNEFSEHALLDENKNPEE
jgi:hypothetical protein